MPNTITTHTVPHTTTTTTTTPCDEILTPAANLSCPMHAFGKEGTAQNLRKLKTTPDVFPPRREKAEGCSGDAPRAPKWMFKKSDHYALQRRASREGMNN